MAKQAFPCGALVAAQRASGIDFEKADSIRREHGLDGLTVTLPLESDDPAFDTQVLGLEERGFCSTRRLSFGQRWTLAR